MPSVTPSDTRSAADGPVVALLTPLGRGAIATLAIAGPGALEAVAGLFQPASGKSLHDSPRRRIVFGRWISSGEEVVACVSSDVQIEVHCHGGLQAAECIAESLSNSGCRRSEWSDWTRRTMPGQIEYQAWRLLAQASTLRTASILLDQRQGALRRELESVRLLVVDPQPKSGERARARLEALLARAPLGCHLARPFQVVLAGPPNVGKSSLINALLGFQRAVVFDQPGTTRDVVTANTVVQGWPVVLSDTAGLRDSDDPLEQEGMRLAADRLRQSDLKVLVFEAGVRRTTSEERLAAEFPGALHVWNKIDLVPHETSDTRSTGALRASALTGQGIDDVLAAIGQRLAPAPPEPGAPLPFLPEQAKGIAQALDYLAGGSTTDAAQVLAALLA